MKPHLSIRELREDEFASLGRLMVAVYSSLEGFPGPEEQPAYYEMLANIGTFTQRNDAKVLVALSAEDELVGGVVYFGDMSEYGSGGIATRTKNASGIRLLAIDQRFRGIGAGRALTEACIALAAERGHSQVILHTAHAMQLAWQLYERIGFRRSGDLDFMQGELPVFGFRYALNNE
ncbi:MAG: GNAT family N-acetyltransferase [Proteobacteria bacterium]|nr:GNAT family N-acetyltransferase [Pseudomonadota bacterium]